MTQSAATTGDVLAEAISAYGAGDLHRAYQLFEETLAAVRHGAAAGTRDADAATWYLARISFDTGQPRRAQAQLLQLIADLEADTADPHDIYATLARVTLGDLLRRTGNLADAAAQYRSVVRLRADDPDHPSHWAVFLAQAGLARIDADAGRHPEARDALTRVAAEIGRRFGLHHSDALLVLRDLADLHIALGDHDAAAVTLRLALTAATEQYGPTHRVTTALDQHLAAVTAASSATTSARPRPQSPSSGPARRPAPQRRPGRPRRRRPIWQGLCVLLALTVVAASLATFVAFQAAAPSKPQPPSRSNADTAGQTSGRPGPSNSIAAALPAPQPPANVRVAPVPGTPTSLDITWDDPSGGTRATVVSLAREGQPLRARATVQAATSHYRLTELTVGVRYCIAVATAYSATLLVAADPVCVQTTHRASAIPRGG